MKYCEHSPEPALVGWVECVWTLESEGAVPGYPVRPDGCMDLIYAPDRGLQVVGAMTVERRFDLAAGARTVGVRFRPGMAGAVLRVEAAELTDQTIALEDVWGARARAVEARVVDAASLGAAAQVLRDALPAPDAGPDAVRRAIAAITATHGDIDLEWVARQAGISPRQFRRRCLKASGLTPKHLCRVLRFRRVCALAGPGVEWAGVAATAGYFDQSHLIRDFREFTGDTPMSVFSNTGEGVAGYSGLYETHAGFDCGRDRKVPAVLGGSNGLRQDGGSP
jgi:AraC-like DNA-binding protein